VFDRILVGVDRETRGRDAIALACQLAGDEGELTLANVDLFPAGAKGAGAVFASGERAASEALLAEVRTENALDAQTRAIRAPSVGRGLHRLAEAESADLLVVGSTRHGRLGRVFLADGTRQALAGAPCAVAVAPGGYADRARPLRLVGVGFNDSGEARHALDVAREIAAELGASLAALEVVSLPPLDVGSVTFREIRAEMSLSDACARIRERGVSDARSSYGNPVDELTDFSAIVDLLILGSRAHGPVGRLLHGSTSRHLAHVALGPLLILTRADQAQMAGIGASGSDDRVADDPS
jgi:nucleotide-binding universal stress UspA family protein